MILSRKGDTLQLVEKQRYQSTIGWLAIGLAVIAVIFDLLTPLAGGVAVGALFFFVGFIMVRNSETRTTTFYPDGNITIEYKRIFGGKKWVRRLNRSDIKSLDYVKGFDEQPRMGSNHRWSYIYLNVAFGEQIEIGTRLAFDWHISKIGLPWRKLSTPLDAEAAEIGSFLAMPVNTINSVTVTQNIKNFYNPRDKMAVALQRPTQEQLDHERDVIAATPPQH